MIRYIPLPVIATQSSQFEELFGQLLTFELRLESHNALPNPEQPSTALFTNRAPQPNSSGVVVAPMVDSITIVAVVKAVRIVVEVAHL